MQWSFQESSQIVFIMGGEFEKQEGCNVICLKTFDDLISSKFLWKKRVIMLMRQACGLGELGQRWDLKKGQPPRLQQCLEERLEVEISHVNVNKACDLNGP